jgi:hypothetical protein
MAQQVERGALGGKQGTRGARGPGHGRRHLVAPLALGGEALEALRARLPEGLFRGTEAEQDALLLLDDARAGQRIGRHDRVRRDVARPYVLRQRPGDEVL